MSDISSLLVSVARACTSSYAKLLLLRMNNFCIYVVEMCSGFHAHLKAMLCACLALHWRNRKIRNAGPTIKEEMWREKKVYTFIKLLVYICGQKSAAMVAYTCVWSNNDQHQQTIWGNRINGMAGEILGRRRKKGGQRAHRPKRKRKNILLELLLTLLFVLQKNINI